MVGSVRIFMFEQSAVVLFADSGGEERVRTSTRLFLLLSIGFVGGTLVKSSSTRWSLVITKLCTVFKPLGFDH